MTPYIPSIDRSERRPLLLPLVFHQGVDHRIEVAGDDVVELVEREVDAVVGQAVFGEIVGADPLAAVAGADLGLALVGRFLCSSSRLAS